MWSFRNPLPRTRLRRAAVLSVWAVSTIQAAPLAFRTHDLPWAAFGTPYHAAVETQPDGRCLDGGVRLSIAAGRLPRGLELHGAAIEGTPQEFGAFPMRVRASNNCAAAEGDFVLQVTGRPILRTSADEIVLDYRAGDPLPDARTVLISASWPDLPYTVTKGKDAWLEVEQEFGATPGEGSPFAGDVVRIRVAPAKLATGTYESALLFSAPHGAANLAVPVRLRVAAPAAGGTQ